jgi:AcrR family transcriptional regulator
MPKTRPSADETRLSILRSAKKLFMKQGFAVTSMSMVATTANINRSLIFHHFGNKQQLWLAVKLDIVDQAEQQSPVLPSLDLSWTEYLKQWLRNNIAFYRNNPDIIAMINWQRTEAQQAPHVGTQQSRTTREWISVLQHFQKRGDIGSEINLGFALTLITSITGAAALDPNIFIKQKKDLRQYLDFCTQLIIDGLR